jgi:hypothetical protein
MKELEDIFDRTLEPFRPSPVQVKLLEMMKGQVVLPLKIIVCSTPKLRTDHSHQSHPEALGDK